MTTEDVYRRADVLWRGTCDRVIILVPASGELITLQATAGDLWAALEFPGSLGELAERLAAVYDAPAERIAGDVKPALDELARRGALAVSRFP